MIKVENTFSFLYTCNEQLEFKIQNTISFILVPKEEEEEIYIYTHSHTLKILKYPEHILKTYKALKH